LSILSCGVIPSAQRKHGGNFKEVAETKKMHEQFLNPPKAREKAIFHQQQLPLISRFPDFMTQNTLNKRGI